MAEELTNVEFEEFIKKGKCVVDFFAEWCMPCLMMAPVFDEVADKFKDIKFGKMDIDSNRGLAEKFNVMSIPCIIMFKNGKETGRIIGQVSEEVLEEKISNLE